jgi:hypothetical protein
MTPLGHTARASKCCHGHGEAVVWKKKNKQKKKKKKKKKNETPWTPPAFCLDLGMFTRKRFHV